jgi:GT2 family glycosyltransferase
MVGKLVSVVIITLNRFDKLKNCIQSVIDNNFQDIELIIIDNGSTDGTKEYLENLEYSHLNVILNTENLGLAKARNQGILVSKGKFILIVDDDNVISKDMIKNILELFNKDPKVGFVSPKTYYKDYPNKIWFYGAKINLYTSKVNFFHANEVDDKDDIIENLETSIVHNCFMIRRDVFEKAGMFDNLLFVSYTELDLCMKVSKYYNSYICGKAKCYHDRLVTDELNSLESYGFTNLYRVFYLIRNRAIIIKRYGNKLQTIIFTLLFYPLFFLYYGLIIIKYKRLDYLKYHLKGFISGILYIANNHLNKI